MKPMSITEARRHFSAIVAAAERGEAVEITRHGKVVARVRPAGTGAGKPLPDLSEFRASIRVKGKPLSQVVIEARRQGRY